MGRIVFGGAMSHVLDPDYYERACGALGRQTVVAVMAEIARMGERLSARQPDALIVVADDHLNAFSFNCVPAMCVRIGRRVQRMAQDHAEAFDKVLDHMPTEYPLHEALANAILEQGMEAGFDLGAHAAVLHSWESDVMDYSTGFDVGMTVAKNVWISLGYNFAGFRDDDFTASRHTAQGPYLGIRIKADQDTFKDLNLDSLRPSR